MRPTWMSPDRRIRLWLGDCLDVMPTMKGGVVHATVIDPPYGIKFQSNKRQATPQFDPIDNDKQPFIEWISEAFRLSRESGCCVCFYRWDVQEPFVVALRDAGFSVTSQIVWYKSGGAIGDLKSAFGAEHELALFAKRSEFAFPGIRPMSVYKVHKVSPSDMVHPTEKPVALMFQIIRHVTPVDGIVMDPCMGVGSTGRACVRLGRGFIGIEKDPNYFATAVRRIEAQLKERRFTDKNKTWG